MPNLARRVIMLAGAAAAIAPSVRRARSENAIAPAAPANAVIADPSYPFSLPPVPYAFIANETHIDAQTKELHHDKHHAASGVSWRRRRNATKATTALSCPGWRAAHYRCAVGMVCPMSADGPHAGQRALLTYAGFILPPDFQRFAGSVGR